jgi:hypothetical protein
VAIPTGDGGGGFEQMFGAVLGNGDHAEAKYSLRGRGLVSFYDVHPVGSSKDYLNTKKPPIIEWMALVDTFK